MAKRRRTKPSPARHSQPRQPVVAPQEPARETRAITVAVVLILVAGLWAYSNGLNGVFVLDDVRAIVRNETIRSLSPIAGPFSPPSASTVSGRPVANFTFALNYAISELNVRSYHLFNVAIHLGCALTLFGVVRRSLLRFNTEHRGFDATFAAASAALIWVVHPLTTSAVTYIVQRVESLMSLFYLLTLYCAIRGDSGGGSRGRLPPSRNASADHRSLGGGGQPAWDVASFISCALGMATKEVMVTAPVAVLLWDVVFRRRVRWRLFAGLASTWMIFALLVSNEFRTPSIGLSGVAVWHYLLAQAEVLTRYLWLSFVPSPLIFLYTWPLENSLTAVIPEALLILLLVVATGVGIWKRYPLGYAGAMFFLILAPTSSVIPIVTEVAAEHRMYLPLAAIISSVIACAYYLAQRSLADRPAKAVVAAATLIVVAVYGSITRARNMDYASEQQLWSDTVAKDPDNQRARVGYASVLAQSGRLSDAEEQFRRAVELNPSDSLAQSRLGSALAAQGKMAAAVAPLKQALSLNPGDVEAHRTLGQILAMQREDAEAIVHLERALQTQPDDPQLLVQVASVRADSKDPSVRDVDRAIVLAERAVERTSRREATALDVLGVAYARKGRFVEAISAAKDALAIARAAGNAAAVESIESRLQAYEARLGPSR